MPIIVPMLNLALLCLFSASSTLAGKGKKEFNFVEVERKNSKNSGTSCSETGGRPLESKLCPQVDEISRNLLEQKIPYDPILGKRSDFTRVGEKPSG